MGNKKNQHFLYEGNKFIQRSPYIVAMATDTIMSTSVRYI